MFSLSELWSIDNGVDDKASHETLVALLQHTATTLSSFTSFHKGGNMLELGLNKSMLGGSKKAACTTERVHYYG